MENEKELNMLFGENTDGHKEFKRLKQETNNEFKQICEQTENPDKISPLDVVKNIINELDDSPDYISNINSEEVLEDEEELPITDVTEGIHFNDETDNTQPISISNSNRLIQDENIANEDDIEIISSHNSSKFVIDN